MTTEYLSKEMKFFIYLLERYAESRDTTADAVLEQWDELGVAELIFDMYDLYHVEKLENAFTDIDDLVAEKRNVAML
ncbi:DUF3791 domain-containing protein [uncultured Cardiobacterium sp.]|jgi:hypothetical protein|uniref:DUF3791 domain-containing protein n=1 Tax=uncultured Cardiobacterium sp. TaxID=417619 RepID=UPI0026311FFD|nr:DUF3791 domain-containing protein [uncultured Cardiobacterium sp.]